MYCPGECSYIYVYLIVFLYLTISQSTDAAATFDPKTNQITSQSQPPLSLTNLKQWDYIQKIETGLASYASYLTKQKRQRIFQRITNDTKSGTELLNDSARIASSPFYVLRKGRTEIRQLVENGEMAKRTRRNTEKYAMKLGSVQNKDDIFALRLLSMIMPNNRGKSEVENGFPLFLHGSPSGFDFTKNSGILEDSDNYDEDDDDAIELGSFGGHIPPIFHMDLPPLHLTESHSPKMEGHQKGDWTETSSRKSGDTEWLDTPVIELHSHPIDRRSSGLKGRHASFSTQPNDVPILTFILSGPQETVDPNIPLHRRLIL